jgi:hypothetical protein
MTDEGEHRDYCRRSYSREGKEKEEQADNDVTALYYDSDGEEECSSYIEAVIDAACKQAQCDVLNRFLGILERLIRENK